MENVGYLLASETAELGDLQECSSAPTAKVVVNIPATHFPIRITSIMLGFIIDGNVDMSKMDKVPLKLSFVNADKNSFMTLSKEVLQTNYDMYYTVPNVGKPINNEVYSMLFDFSGGTKGLESDVEIDLPESSQICLLLLLSLFPLLPTHLPVFMFSAFSQTSSRRTHSSSSRFRSAGCTL